MAVIYLRHPVHGTKVASMDSEAAYDKLHGWEVFDPAAASDLQEQAEPVNSLVSEPSRRGRRRKEPSDGDSR